MRSNLTLTYYPIGSRACNTPRAGVGSITYVRLQLWNNTLVDAWTYACVVMIATSVGNLSVREGDVMCACGGCTSLQLHDMYVRALYCVVYTVAV